MPDKPAWAPRINDIAYELSALPDLTISSARLQVLLGVSPRQAQAILKPVVTVHKGKRGLAAKEAVLKRLKEIAGASAEEEAERQKDFWGRKFGEMQNKWKEKPPLFVEIQTDVQFKSRLDNIEGVTVVPGEIRVTFSSGVQALERLAALVSAIQIEALEFVRMMDRPAGTATGGAR